MEKNQHILGGGAIRYLKNAALHPRGRGEMIEHALQDLLDSLSAVGTALIWPCQDRNAPWKLYYAGTQPESICSWLADRLEPSLDATLAVLQRDLARLSDLPLPQLICLRPAPRFPVGLWIIWTPLSPPSCEVLDYQEEVCQTLEALIEVEGLEESYFSSASPLSDPALIEALGQGDPYALSALLSMTRLVGNAELTFWGRAYQDVVECTDHMGARQSGFGFTVPHGQGVGGHIAAFGTPILSIEDYRSSPYRHPSACDILDGERVRSVVAFPVRTRQEEGGSGKVAGILYAARRTVRPFSLAEQLLIKRITHQLEPLPPLTRPSSFLAFGLPPVPDQKAAWHKLILCANHIESLETWVGQFIRGTIIVTDGNGRPYVSPRSEQLEYLQAGFDSPKDSLQVISLDVAGMSSPGQVYLRSGIPLPPASWPDFFTDLVMACNLIIERMEQAHDHLASQREQWLQAVLQENFLAQISQDGYRLGLPIKGGQLWVVAWPTQKLLAQQAVHQRMLVENMVLDQLKVPPLFLGDDVGVILLDKHVEQHPAKLYEDLLTQFAPHPLWIVYGARYHSLRDLKTMLTYSICQAQEARREEQSEYLLDVQTPAS